VSAARPIAGFKGPTSKGRQGRRWDGERKGGEGKGGLAARS